MVIRNDKSQFYESNRKIIAVNPCFNRISFVTLFYALKKTGQKPEAVAMFQKSLDLNPSNGNAKKMLQELAK
jgi:hypothetical protein